MSDKKIKWLEWFTKHAKPYVWKDEKKGPTFYGFKVSIPWPRRKTKKPRQ